MEMSVEDLEGSVTKITLRGRMDTAGAASIDLKFNAITGARKAVIVDLSGVDFLASMGMRALLMGAKTVSRHGGRLVLLNPEPAVAGVLKTAGIDVIIPIHSDPTRAIEAVMDGFRVMTMTEAAKIGDIFVTVTGNKSVLASEHFEKMKDGAVLCNSGHFNVEIDIPALEKMASSKRTTRNFVEEYSLKDGRKINLLGEGRLINLAAAEGHPASVMDMSFADQALSVEYMVKNAKTLEKKVYKVPDDLDKRVAKLKLESMGIKIDKLTPEQEEYLAGWSEGT